MKLTGCSIFSISGRIRQQFQFCRFIVWVCCQLPFVRDQLLCRPVSSARPTLHCLCLRSGTALPGTRLGWLSLSTHSIINGHVGFWCLLFISSCKQRAVYTAHHLSSSLLDWLFSRVTWRIIRLREKGVHVASKEEKLRFSGLERAEMARSTWNGRPREWQQLGLPRSSTRLMPHGP